MYIHAKQGEQAMVIAKVFQSGNSQAIRIPSEFHTDEKEFYIRQFNGAFYLIPVNDPWYLVKNSVGKVKNEKLERNQPSLSTLPKRELF